MASKEDRNTLLYKSKPVKPLTDITRCILTYSHQNQLIKNIITKYLSILTDEPVPVNYVTTKSSITYRRTTSLRDSLVHSHFSEGTTGSPPAKGTFPCGACDACGSLDTRREAVSARWGQVKPEASRQLLHDGSHLPPPMPVPSILRRQNQQAFQCTNSRTYLGSPGRLFSHHNWPSHGPGAQLQI